MSREAILSASDLNCGPDRKSVVVDSTLNNVYVRIPESTVSVPCILSDIGKKTSIDPEELVILDNKMIPVSDDKGVFMSTLQSACTVNPRHA